MASFLLLLLHYLGCIWGPSHAPLVKSLQKVCFWSSHWERGGGRGPSKVGMALALAPYFKDFQSVILFLLSIYSPSEVRGITRSHDFPGFCKVNPLAPCCSYPSHTYLCSTDIWLSPFSDISQLPLIHLLSNLKNCVAVASPDQHL